MARNIKIEFGIQSGFSQTDFPHSLYTGSTSGGTYTLIASNVVTDYTLPVSNSESNSTIYIKLTCPGCKEQIYPIRVVPEDISIKYNSTLCVTCPDNSEGILVPSLTLNGAENDGYINIDACGGAPPYTYSWVASTNSDGFTGVVPSGQSNSENLTNLTGGLYTVTVSDCYGLSTTRTFNVVEPFGFTFGITGSTLTCIGGSDGTITVGGSGANPGYTYSIDGGANYQSSPVFTGLPFGTYTIRIRDTKNCYIERTSYVTNPDPCNPPTNVTVVLTNFYEATPTPTPTATPTPTPTATPTPTPTPTLCPNGCGSTISDTYLPTTNTVQTHCMNLSSATNGSTISIQYTAYDRPNRFNIYDDSNNLVVSSQWVGADNTYAGPWGGAGSLADADGSGYMTFTYNSSKTYSLKVDVGPSNPNAEPPNPSDGWSVTVSCLSAPTPTPTLPFGSISVGTATCRHNNCNDNATCGIDFPVTVQGPVGYDIVFTLLSHSDGTATFNTYTDTINYVENNGFAYVSYRLDLYDYAGGNIIATTTQSITHQSWWPIGLPYC